MVFNESYVILEKNKESLDFSYYDSLYEFMVDVEASYILDESATDTIVEKLKKIIEGFFHFLKEMINKIKLSYTKLINKIKSKSRKNKIKEHQNDKDGENFNDDNISSTELLFIFFPKEEVTQTLNLLIDSYEDIAELLNQFATNNFDSDQNNDKIKSKCLNCIDTVNQKIKNIQLKKEDFTEENLKNNNISYKIFEINSNNWTEMIPICDEKNEYEFKQGVNILKNHLNRGSNVVKKHVDIEKRTNKIYAEHMNLYKETDSILSKLYSACAKYYDAANKLLDNIISHNEKEIDRAYNSFFDDDSYFDDDESED